MKKPSGYEETCMTVRNIPYQLADERYKGMSMTGGVLGKGQTVWVQSLAKTRKRPILITAYVENIGIVSVDPHYLAPVA